MGKSKAPKPPDPRETAAAEAQYNRVNTYDPSGSGVRYGFTDAQGNFVQGQPPAGQQSAMKYVENPFEARIRTMLQPASVQFTERMIQDNVDGLPDAARVQDRGTVAQSIFDRNFSLMAPAIDRSNERLLTNLQARGLPIGGEAFNDAYGDQQTRTQDTIARLAMDADIASGQEQTRQFGLDQAQRQGAISEIIGAMTGNFSPASPMPSGNASPINYSGMVGNQYQAQLEQANAANAQRMNTASTLGTIGSALIKSSVHTKTDHGIANVSDAAAALMEIPVKMWAYLPHERPPHDHGGMHIGPMAQDFQRATGLGRPDRIDVVDYLGVVTAALQAALARVELLERAIYGDPSGKRERMH